MSKQKIKVVKIDELPKKITAVLKEITEAFETENQEQEEKGLECEKHLEHYKEYIAICFDKDNNKIGTLHTDDPTRIELFMKESGEDDGYIRKVTIYRANSIVIDRTKYNKGKKKKSKNIEVILAP